MAFRIGTRIFVGFLAVLSLLVLVAGSGYLGAVRTEQRVQTYAEVSHHAAAMIAIARDAAELRWGVYAYVYAGDDKALGQIHTLRPKLDDAITAALARVKGGGGQASLERMKQLFDSYTKSFDAIVTMRSEREALVQSTMNVLGTEAQRLMHDIMAAAMADGHSEVAAMAGHAQEKLLLARLNAVHFLADPSEHWISLTKEYNQAFVRSVGRLLNVQGLAETEMHRLAERALDIASRYERAFNRVVTVTQDYHARTSRTMYETATEFAALASTLNEMAVQELVRIESGTHDRLALSKLIIGSVAAAAILLGLILAWRITVGLTRPLAAMTLTLTRLAHGDSSVTIPALTRQDEIGDMARAADVFQQMTRRTEDERWVKTNLSEASTVMQMAWSLSDVAQVLISHIVPVLGGGVGLFYYHDETQGDLVLLSGFGIKVDEDNPLRIGLGEGLAGQCAADHKPLIVTQIPDGFFDISTGLGQAKPDTVIAAPLYSKDRLLGVIEIGLFGTLDERRQSFLDEALPIITLNLENLDRSLRTQELLAESRLQSEQLRINEEELKAQREELQATNDELRDKTHMLEDQAQELRASEEELKAQREELRAINEELMEKTRILEQQKQIVERARSEAEAKARELDIASRYKSEFLANMSHELRTPLNSLLILAKSFADNEEGNLSEDQVEAATIILDSGSHLLHLINDILDLSKVEAGKMDILPQEVDLAAFLAETERSYRHLALGKGLEFSTVREEGIPARLITDRSRLDQIMGNLVSNAVKFTETGKVTLRISPAGGSAPSGDDRSTAEDSAAALYPVVAIAITDTGIGIPEEKLSAIFRAFEQADGTTSRRYGGTGLGLSISQKLAELLGGRIEVESRVGEGSTFTLLLPSQPPQPGTAPEALPVMEAPQRLAPVPTPPPATGERAGKTIGDGDQGWGADQAGEEAGKAEEAAEKAAPDGSPPALSPSAPHFAQTPEEVQPPLFVDDRDTLAPEDRTILVIEDDSKFAHILCDLSRRKGFKCLCTNSGTDGLALAHKYKPTGVVLDVGLPDMIGWQVIDRLKEDPKTRHIPVHFISAYDESLRALERGAVGYFTKPVSREEIETVFDRIEYFVADRPRRLLIVDDDEGSRRAIRNLIASEGIEIDMAGSGEEALERLREKRFDCLILDLGLPGISGFEFLEQATRDEDIVTPPVVVYSGRDLDREDSMRLREYTDSIVIKGARSPERLLDEVTLFLHSVETQLPAEQQRLLRLAHQQEPDLAGRTVLVVDDDMRNTFALSRALRARGLKVLMAQDGTKALTQLQEQRSAIDIVLMDIMMPGKDGYETIRDIRADPHFARLPILALTAKAMTGDREKCLEAGANDYLAKPIDMDRLLSMLRAWLQEK